MKDKIIASVASMPSRSSSLMETVNSIVPQVDELHVYLNDYNIIPEYLNYDKIKIFLSQNEVGDLGDVGKFFTSGKIEGYHFTIDDDLIYPEDYVKNTIEVIEKYNRKCVVSYHGRRFHKFPISSYYRSARVNDRFACLRDEKRFEWLHIGGSGVTAYHTDTIKFDVSDFKAKNMADIWYSKKCQENKVPILHIPHKKGYIIESEQYDKNTSIFAHCHVDDTYQTNIINSINWDLHRV